MSGDPESSNPTFEHSALIAAQRHEQVGGNSVITSKVKGVEYNLAKAISQSEKFDPEGGSVSKTYEDRVLNLLTGVEALSDDPHGLVNNPKPVSAEDATRLAEFVKIVSKLGTLNPDGSVTLNRKPDNNSSVQTINIPAK